MKNGRIIPQKHGRRDPIHRVAVDSDPIELSTRLSSIRLAPVAQRSFHAAKLKGMGCDWMLLAFRIPPFGTRRVYAVAVSGS